MKYKTNLPAVATVERSDLLSAVHLRGSFISVAVPKDDFVYRVALVLTCAHKSHILFALRNGNVRTTNVLNQFDPARDHAFMDLLEVMRDRNCVNPETIIRPDRHRLAIASKRAAIDFLHFLTIHHLS